MKCPICGAWSTVKETRDSSLFGFKRRRECGNEHRFTTQEVVIPDEVVEQKHKDNLRTNSKQLVAVRQSGRKTTRKAA